MAVTVVTETLEIGCSEEGRRARLQVEWAVGPGDRRELVGIHCDNPRLAAETPWDCRWSCWESVAGSR